MNKISKKNKTKNKYRLLLPVLDILVECNPACLDNNIRKKLQNVTEFGNLQRLIRTRERERERGNYHQTGL